MKKLWDLEKMAISGGELSSIELISACGLMCLGSFISFVVLDRMAMSMKNNAPYQTSSNNGYEAGMRLAPPPVTILQPATFEMGLSAGRELGQRELALRPSAPPMQEEIPVVIATPIFD